MAVSAKSESKAKTHEEAKAALHRWVELTTLHGVVDAFHKDVPMWAKLIWRLVVPLALLLSMYQTAMVVQGHFDTPMWSSTSYTNPDTDVDTVKMPTVTVCSNNKMNYTKIKRYDVDAMLPAMFKTAVGYKGWFQTHDNASVGPGVLDEGVKNASEAEQRALSFACDDMVLQVVRLQRTACNRRRFYEPTVCTDGLQEAQWLRTETDFDLFSAYPACCQITLADGFDAMHSAGATDSLTVILINEPQVNIPVLMNNLNEPGFSVHFHYGPIIDTNSFLPVPPGWMSKVVLGPHASKLNPPNVIDSLFATRPPCTEHTPSMVYYKPTHYIASVCENDCLLQEQVRLCQCEPHTLADRRRKADNVSKPPGSALPCTDHEFLACDQRAGAESSMVAQSAERKACRKKCMPLCDAKTVTVATSTSKILPGKQAALAGAIWRLNETKPSSIRNRVAVLSVEFGSIQYTKTTIYLSGSVMNLLSSLGGSISLWLGASMLTLLQLVIALANVIAALVNNGQRAKAM